MRKIIKQTQTSNLAVAYLDIVGFKEIVGKYSASKIGNVFYCAIKSAKRDIKNWVNTFNNQYKHCHISVFSDSVVIFSPDNSIEGVKSVVLHAQRIMQNLVIQQFLVRGAIATGEVFKKKNPLIFVGAGYMKAWELESKQEWFGIAIDKSIEENFPAFFEKDNLISKVNFPDSRIIYYYSHPYIVRYPVPMKCGYKELLYTVNWLDKFAMLDKNRKKLPDINFVENFKKILPLGAVNQNKYKNTLDYIEYVNSIIAVDAEGVQRCLVHNDKYT